MNKNYEFYFLCYLVGDSVHQAVHHRGRRRRSFVLLTYLFIMYARFYARVRHIFTLLCVVRVCVGSHINLLIKNILFCIIISSAIQCMYEKELQVYFDDENAVLKNNLCLIIKLCCLSWQIQKFKRPVVEIKNFVIMKLQDLMIHLKSRFLAHDLYGNSTPPHTNKSTQLDINMVFTFCCLIK